MRDGCCYRACVVRCALCCLGDWGRDKERRLRVGGAMLSVIGGLKLAGRYVFLGGKQGGGQAIWVVG